MADTESRKRGRPQKKPNYDRAEEINELVTTAVELFAEPYDDRVGRSEDAPTLLDVARAMGMTSIKVRKLLITAGYYSTDLSREVQKLREHGCSSQEIMDRTGLNHASVNGYLPYSKGAYKLENPTVYAEQGRLFRTRKAACEKLGESATDQDLWAAIEAFAGYPFKAPDGSSLKYQMDGDEMVFVGELKVRITKSNVIEAFHRRNNSDERTERTNSLLEPIFCRICGMM